MPNNSVLTDSEGVTDAWIKAVKFLRTQKHRRAYNLVYSVTDPGNFQSGDAELVSAYDRFALDNEISSATTVANTIFPLDFYLNNGKAGLFERYDTEIYPRVKTQWGNYFDRMTRRRGANGKVVTDASGAPLNPLAVIVDKLGRRISEHRGSKNHYEIAIADEGFELTTYLPERDRNYPRGGPCLSHLSFKVDDADQIRLTAFYRSHYYLEKALGNLIGLARLQAFVALEVGASVGPLTCIASLANLEATLPSADAASVSEFLDSCGA